MISPFQYKSISLTRLFKELHMCKQPLSKPALTVSLLCDWLQQCLMAQDLGQLLSFCTYTLPEAAPHYTV